MWQEDTYAKYWKKKKSLLRSSMKLVNKADLHDSNNCRNFYEQVIKIVCNFVPQLGNVH